MFHACLLVNLRCCRPLGTKASVRKNLRNIFMNHSLHTGIYDTDNTKSVSMISTPNTYRSIKIFRQGWHVALVGLYARFCVYFPFVARITRISVWRCGVWYMTWSTCVPSAWIGIMAYHVISHVLACKQGFHSKPLMVLAKRLVSLPRLHDSCWSIVPPNSYVHLCGTYRNVYRI